jgi:hypothetical protein
VKQEVRESQAEQMKLSKTRGRRALGRIWRNTVMIEVHRNVV